ncbi:MAG: hypothetical protein FD123_1129 [Bacteroidetes bacterium]|nr:MAG: hypothetical protein FD123_1129 [Bacteroidota bacterium]
MEKFTFFYRSKSPSSQWYPCIFRVNDVKYNCTEQFMMHQKALLFGDREMADKIMQKTNPRDQKALGRKVRNFDAEVYRVKAKRIVYKGNYAKFAQNENLKKHLLDTTGTSLAEARPTDIIWGIGMTEENPDRFDRSKWRGTNWLGEVLTQVREDLIKKHKTENK